MAEADGPPIVKRSTTRAPLGKLNPHHDERGQFATADGAVATVGSVARKPRPTRVQVAGNDVMSDVGGLNVAQIIEPEPPPPIEPAKPEPAEPPKRPEGTQAAATGSVADSVAPGGILPGDSARLGNPRNMPATDDPDSTARAFAVRAFGGRPPISLDQLGGGGFKAKISDYTFITFRPAGQASWKTPGSTASVDINDPEIKRLNDGEILKLKFPKRLTP